MPARIAVHLAPATSRAPVPPPHTGPAVGAAFLAALRDSDEADLATALHETRPPKPYALTPLLDEHHRRASADSNKVRFEIGVLADPLTGPVLQALTTASAVRIARCHYRIAAVDLLAAEPYPDLLAASRPTTRWSLTIHTPVAFFTAREEGARRTRPFPEPEWVFADLRRRWSAFTDPAGDLDEVISGHLEVVHHRLVMADHLVKAGAPPARGSVGTITYGVAEPHRLAPDALTALDALARFAAYAGIGDRTAVGMGHVQAAAAPPPTSGARPR